LGLLTAIVEGGRLRDDHPHALPVPWWSLTKTVLAASSLTLVAEGRLALDAPCRFGPFSLRQLLRHTAGVPEYGALADYQDAVARNDPPWSEQELLRRVDAHQLLFAPDQSWSYSNVGYLYVRRLIEETTGEDLEDSLRHLVLAPLGVPGVRLARQPSDLAATAWGNARRYHPGWVYHGLLLGTPAEAALFLDRLLGGAAPALRDAMSRRHAVGGPMPGRPWKTLGYGLGLFIDPESLRGRCLGHTGEGPGSVAAAYHFPDIDPTLSIAAFADVDDPGVVERAVLDLAA